MADTTAQHIAARNDANLAARLTAVAEQAQIPNAETFVQMNMGRLVSAPIEGDTTVTAVHAYAAEVYRVAVSELPPPPGLNPAAVTDAQLAEAVMAVWQPTQGE